MGRNHHRHLVPVPETQTITIQQSDNYATWSSAAVPATITRGGWTEVKVTVPVTVGPGGLQRVGVQLLNAGAAYTGNFTWTA